MPAMTCSRSIRPGWVSHGRRSLFPLLLGLLAAGPAAAQTPILTPGARVRVEAPALGPDRAARRLVGQRGDTLLLVPDRRAGGDTIAVALTEIRGLEVSRGWRRRALLGAAVGLAAGAAAGAAVGYNASEPPDPPECIWFCKRRDTRREDAALFALVGAQYGMGLGALVGRFVLGERWERLVPSGGRVSAGLTAAGGARVAVTFR
jgi:hypothetical protein